MSGTGRPRPTRRHDPERRERIIDAALEVIARHGVSGTTMRRVAAVADVPLGSMSYHFSGTTELLTEAFLRFTDDSVEALTREFEHVASLEQARAAVVRIVTCSAYMRTDNIVIGSELYSLATHDDAFRPLQLSWMHRSRDAMLACFDEQTTHMLDAMIEAVSVHRTFEVHRHPDALVRRMVERLTPPGSYVGPGADG